MPYRGAGVGRAAGVLQDAEIPAGAEHSDLGPLFGESRLHGCEGSLREVQNQPGSEPVHLGSARRDLQEGAPECRPIKGLVGTQ